MNTLHSLFVSSLKMHNVYFLIHNTEISHNISRVFHPIYRTMLTRLKQGRLLRAMFDSRIQLTSWITYDRRISVGFSCLYCATCNALKWRYLNQTIILLMFFEQCQDNLQVSLHILHMLDRFLCFGPPFGPIFCSSLAVT